ncbi:UDP-N-acetylglucosamine 2-epimerase [Halomicrobium sp. IBSBa]|uniref:UDP-N-acetylglucosamine 2-epimerase n=1 Tax=Halomicrobium sp. IBSBa TaxID=2778916 RepID=UPI001FC8F7CE|nr:UDP-N-acetylglucosamine 2-epimerase [Halomicrobium sp. IBSBa]
MAAIEAHDDLELATIVTGMHLAPAYGNTHEDITNDGFEITRRVNMLMEGDDGLDMAKSLGLGTMGLAEAFRDVDPDIVLVLGDRDEPLAAALAAAHMNIPVAHIHGGDVMMGATIDDSIRYALTKFAHIHFPASEASARRVAQLGETEWRITIAGAPGLDPILRGEYRPGQAVVEDLELDPTTPIVLVVQHPVTTAPERAGKQMQTTLDAVTNYDVQPVVIYPNSDAGGKQIVDVIESHPASDEFETFKSLPRPTYLGLMEAAATMVGNSSSGIIESSSFDLPVVDIGPREEGRQRADNTISVPHQQGAIESAIDQALFDEAFRERVRECDNPYAYGGAGERIADRLADIQIDERLLQKEISF